MALFSCFSQYSKSLPISPHLTLVSSFFTTLVTDADQQPLYSFSHRPSVGVFLKRWRNNNSPQPSNNRLPSTLLHPVQRLARTHCRTLNDKPISTLSRTSRHYLDSSLQTTTTHTTTHTPHTNRQRTALSNLPLLSTLVATSRVFSLTRSVTTLSTLPFSQNHPTSPVSLHTVSDLVHRPDVPVDVRSYSRMVASAVAS